LTALTSALVLAVIATGCFETKTEYWFRSDGSGKAVFDLGVSEELAPKLDELAANMKQGIAERDGDSNIEDASVETYEDGDFAHLMVSVDVADMTALPKDSFLLFKHDPGQKGVRGGDGMVNGVTIKRLSSGNILFEQKFPHPHAGSQSTGANPMAKAMAASFLAGKYATVIVHANKIVSTNGTISEDGKTVAWKIPLADLYLGEKPLPPLRAELSLGWWTTKMTLAAFFVALAIIVPLIVALIVVKSLRYKQ